MRTEKLDSSPGSPLLYGRAALGAVPGASLLPFVGGRGDSLPDLELRLDGVAVDRARLAEYCRVCGFGLRDSLPPTYPHVLAFPLQMRLMADGSFPFPLLGLVHLDNAIVQHRPIAAAEPLDFAVRAEDLRPHPKGRAFTLVAEARVGGELVWEERGTILRRGKGDPDAPAAQRPPAVAADAPAVPEWKLDGGLGRRYAAVSGDRNPIHMHSLSARALGFPRAIAHGMWSMARCLGQIESRLPAALVTEVAFGKPLLLPARVRFAAEERPEGEVGFAIRDRSGEREHLVGFVRPA